MVTQQNLDQTMVPGTDALNSAAAPPPPPPVDTSNLSPGAARRFAKLMDSIDRFTSAVETKALRLPDAR